MRVLLPVLLLLAFILITPITLQLRVMWLKTRYFLHVKVQFGWGRLRIPLLRYRLRSQITLGLPNTLLCNLFRHLIQHVLPGGLYDQIIEIILAQAVRLRQWKGRSGGGDGGLVRLARRLRIRRIDVLVGIGRYDAAGTAVAAGAAWAIAGTLMGVGTAVGLSYDQIRFRVIPLYNRSVLRGRLHCIFTARTADIIFTYVLGWWRGGKRRERTSYSRSDEDSNGEHQGNGGC